MHNTRDVTRGGKGAQFLGRRITTGGAKSHSNVITSFFRTVHLLPKDLRLDMGAPNVYPQAPSNLVVTPLHITIV